MLSWLLPPRQMANPGFGSAWIAPTRVRTLAGSAIDEDTALTYAAVWQASRILCEGVAGLPLFVYQRDDDDHRSQATDLPQYDLLKNQPNPTMGSMALREGRTLHQVNHGNGFAEIERDRAGNPVALWPIHAARVRPARAGDRYSDGTPIEPGAYLVRNNDGSSIALRPEEVLHIPGTFPEDGIWGKGVISYARECVGAGISMERHGATQFGSGNMPRVVLTDRTLKDPEARRTFRREWKELHGSPDSGELAIITNAEAKLDKLSFTSQDSQFLESRSFNKKEVASWYKIPPHMLGEMDGEPKANVEQMSLEFVIYGLMPWIVRWEEALSLKLFTAAQRKKYYPEHQLAGLLRGDLTARMTAYRTAIMVGVLTLNECRRFENLDGIGPAGDVNYVPLNMTTAERMRLGLDQPTRGRGPGSDQNGTPNDGLPGKQPGDDSFWGDQEKAFGEWQARLSNLDGDDLKRRLKAIEDTLASDRRAAALSPPTPPEPKPCAKVREAARAVLVDVLGRMYTKESNAALRAAENKTGDFSAWLAKFYTAHEPLLADALAPAFAVLNAAGCKKADHKQTAAQLVANSRAALEAGYDQLTPKRFRDVISAWPVGRAADDAQAISFQCCGGPGSGVPGPCPEGNQDSPGAQAVGVAEKLGEEVESAAEDNEEVRGAIGKAYDAVTSKITGAALEEFPKWALDTADLWLFEDLVSKAGSQAGVPAAVLLTKAAAFGAAKAYLTLRNLWKGGKSANAEPLDPDDLDAVTAKLHAIITVVGEAGGFNVPTLDYLRGKLEKAKGKAA